jgi:hypothetical protein
LKSRQDIPPELLIPIPDPEKIWLAEQEEMRYSCSYKSNNNKRRKKKKRLRL